MGASSLCSVSDFAVGVASVGAGYTTFMASGGRGAPLLTSARQGAETRCKHSSDSRTVAVRAPAIGGRGGVGGPDPSSRSSSSHTHTLTTTPVSFGWRKCSPPTVVGKA